MMISELMTRDVKSCGPNEPLSAACRIMWENDCGFVPVIDRDGTLAGVITDRDVAMAAYIQGRPLSYLRVADSMAREVLTCTPDDALASALRIMAEAQVNRLPVVDADKRLVGVVSLADVARVAVPRRGGAPRLEAGELAAMLASVRRARISTPPTQAPRARQRTSATPGDRVSS